MKFKRLGNHASPYAHKVVNTLVEHYNARVINADPSFVLAKQFLADLPVTPTNERVYELTQQIQNGLLDSVCDIKDAYNHWEDCLNVVDNYLRSIKVLGF